MAYKFTRRSLALAGGAALATAWLMFVWPTPWREYKSDGVNLRVNRFIGKTESLTIVGWQGYDPPKSKLPTFNNVPIDLPALRQSLEAAGIDAQHALSRVSYTLRYGRYLDALAALDGLKGMPDLTDAQKQVIDRVSGQVRQAAKNQEAAKAASQ